MMRDLIRGSIPELRYEPVTRRIRALLDGEPVADTREAVLVWEPRRVVPTYAVPSGSLVAALEDAGGSDPSRSDLVGLRLPEVTDAPVLDPSIPFAVHSTPGRSFDVIAARGTRPAAAFRPEDADLAGYVVLDFAAFDWREDDDDIVGHPHDPFHRIDVRHSDRHVRLELQGTVLAESRRALLLYESLLPVRYYLLRDDVLADLAPSSTVTYCAYKGRASYFSVDLPGGLPGGDDIAWTYPDPLLDALPVQERVAFFDERLDAVLDGERQDRPVTPWSR